MDRFIKILVLLVATFSISHAHSNKSLLNHANSVGKMMSALYMTKITQGHDKYLAEFKTHRELANKYFYEFLSYQSSDSTLKKDWEAIYTEIREENILKTGWDASENTRRLFRRHQSKIYLLVEDSASEFQNPAYLLDLSLVLLETMISRYIDISTCYYGTVSLSPIDAEMVDLKTISSQFSASLRKLANINVRAKPSLDKALAKWQFIEKIVVNYSETNAHFVIYATKSNIEKTFINDQALMALSN